VEPKKFKWVLKEKNSPQSCNGNWWDMKNNILNNTFWSLNYPFPGKKHFHIFRVNFWAKKVFFPFYSFLNRPRKTFCGIRRKRLSSRTCREIWKVLFFLHDRVLGVNFSHQSNHFPFFPIFSEFLSFFVQFVRKGDGKNFFWIKRR
jgi:hypothetical protein